MAPIRLRTAAARRVAPGTVGHVAGKARGPSADGRGGAFGGGAVDIHRDDTRPGVGHGMGDRLANPRSGAGDQRHPAIEQAGHVVARLAAALSPPDRVREGEGRADYIAAMRAARRRASGVVGSTAGWAAGIRPLSRGNHQSHSSAPIW